MMKREKSKMISYGLVGALLFFTSMVGTQAYLVKGSDKLINRITPGNVAVVLTESHWNPEEGEQMMPGEGTNKDPVVTNHGTLASWIFVRICVPKEDIVCVDPVSHRKMERQKTEIIHFQNNENWELMDKEEQEEMAEYVYGYKKRLPPQKSTENIFDNIQMVSYLEGELNPDKTYELPVKVFAVQGSVAEGENALKEAYRYAFGGDV